MTASVSQDVLNPPTRANGEPTPEWRARYRAASETLIATLVALPGVTIADRNVPEWASNPNILILRTSTATHAPGFQLDANGNPIELVQTVNFRLALRYRDGVGVPWGGREIPRLVWWLKTHPELGMPPIEILGTDREAELVDLATDSRSPR